MPPSRARLTRLRRTFDREVGLRSDHPLTVFLVPASAERPVGRRVCWGGFAVEITYEPTVGPTLPPGGPHKVILGPELDV